MKIITQRSNLQQTYNSPDPLEVNYAGPPPWGIHFGHRLEGLPQSLRLARNTCAHCSHGSSVMFHFGSNLENANTIAATVTPLLYLSTEAIKVSTPVQHPKLTVYYDQKSVTT